MSNVTMFLDGGHTTASLKASVDWWVSNVVNTKGPSLFSSRLHLFLWSSYIFSFAENVIRLLVFNCKQNKPAPALLAPVIATVSEQQLPYDAAYFVASKVRKSRDHSNDITNVLNDDVSPQRALEKVLHFDPLKVNVSRS